MSMKRLNFIGLGGARVRGACLALAFLLVTMTPLSCIGIGAQSDPVAARHLKAFFEAFLERRLSGSELREVADEFVKGHTNDGKSLAALQEIARSFDPHTKILSEHKGSPAALTTRHNLIQWNYFRPVMKDTIFLRWLTEPDPVRVVDPKSRRLMTETDLVGLVNIRNFAKSNGDPIHTELSRQELDRLAIELDRLFGSHPKTERLPQFFGETAAFWAGVRQNWSRLNDQEKSLARAYANKTWRIQMPAEMYGKLLGLNPKAALSRKMDDVSNRMAMITNIQLEITNLPILMDKIFPQ